MTDATRFPSGLGGLANRAHSLGMKFGLWVEPERVSLETVGLPALAQEPWLVTADGSYGSPNTALVCLADAQARQWIWDELVAVIEDTQLDYLKWDNNFWLNCNRPGHGHGPTDGSFSHVQALYGMLAALHDRYPDLMIENVASGGNRLDFGLLQYTDAAWMDDKTDPSSHVRHNLEGLTFEYSPAYLLSFVMDSETEPLSDPDLRFIIRSRMPGAFGLTFRTGALTDDQVAIMADEIAKYKSVRDIVAQSNAILLTDQGPDNDIGWEVIEEVTDDQASALVFAFKASAEDGRLLVRPRGLQSDVLYDVRSIDLGLIGTVSGDSLMTDGIEVAHDGDSPSRAHVLLLQAN
jgi:alpha-galactosidase